MSHADVTKFISALAVHFPRPAKPTNPNELRDYEQKEKLWVESMVSILGTYEDHVLTRAATRILRSETRDRRFPLPAVCRQVCNDILAEDKAAEPRTLVDKASELKGNADWQFRLADELIMCGIGKRAAREGWILSLHDFCRLNGRLPNENWEISKCIESAKGFDRSYEGLLRDYDNPMRRSLIKLGDTMLKRREVLRVRVLGKEAA